MNPFQTYKARVNTIGAQTKIDPRLIHTALGLSASGILAPSVAGGIDLVSGSQKVTSEDANLGELGINYLLSAGLAPAVTGIGFGGTEILNRYIDQKAKAGVSPPSYNPHSTETKKELKRILNEQGADAAAAWNSGQKQKAMGQKTEGNYSKSGAIKRRMAGLVLASLLGAGTTIPLMMDE